jgi:hypothetical protein
MGRSSALSSILLVIVIAATPQWASAQERAIEFAPREEMIDAIMTYAGLGGCATLRDVFGPRLEAIAKGLAGGRSGRSPDAICTAAVSLGELSLHRARVATLIEICTRNGIMSCRKRQEASAGAPVLTFYASIGVKGATATAAWSPDNRFLLVFTYPEFGPLDTPPRRGYTLVIDIERQVSRTLISEPIGIFAVAWSPDGRYIAANKQRAIHLFAADTLAEKGFTVGRGNRCGTHNANRMAFTADSSALWVACGGSGGSYSPMAIAIKFGVPSMQVEDRLFATPHESDWRFRTTAISRLGDDLVLVGQALGRYNDPKIAVRSFNLRTKAPLHPPVIYEAPERSESNPDVFLTDDLSGILIRFFPTRQDGAEVWSTSTGKRIARVNPRTMMYGRSLGAPNRIPSSPLHIEEQWLPTSPRRTLLVIDSQSGASVQELGPVSGSGHAPSRSVLVSPDGKMAAHLGRHEIRFYRVDAGAAALPLTKG